MGIRTQKWHLWEIEIILLFFLLSGTLFNHLFAAFGSLCNSCPLCGKGSTRMAEINSRTLEEVQASVSALKKENFEPIKEIYSSRNWYDWFLFSVLISAVIDSSVASRFIFQSTLYFSPLRPHLCSHGKAKKFNFFLAWIIGKTKC